MKAPDGPVEECANNACQAPIHDGQSIYKVGEDIYCGIRCAETAIAESTPERFII